MNLVQVFDCTGANLAHLPPGQACAGYTTGTPGIAWPAVAWQAHPSALHVDQDPKASDATADVLDVERGAAVLSDIVPWVRAAHAARAAIRRPGQRWPAIYASASNITPIANELQAAGITSGVFFWVANWNLSVQQADTDVLRAGGPWPVIGVQYRSEQYYDVSVFSAAWLGNVAKAAVPAVTRAQAQAALGTVTRYVNQ